MNLYTHVRNAADHPVQTAGCFKLPLAAILGLGGRLLVRLLEYSGSVCIVGRCIAQRVKQPVPGRKDIWGNGKDDLVETVISMCSSRCSPTAFALGGRNAAAFSSTVPEWIQFPISPSNEFSACCRQM